METLPQLFRYTAREYDANTGLYHYRARTYDPATGRFLQEDPIWFAAGDLNVHRYVWNNPMNWVDPSGLSGSVERASMSPIVVGIMAGLTLTTVLAYDVWLREYRNGQYVSVQTTIEVEVKNVGFGCQVGIGYSSVAGQLAGSSTIGLNGETCTAVFSEEAEQPSDGPTDDIQELLKGFPPIGSTSGGTKQFQGSGGSRGREEVFGTLPGIVSDKANGVRVKTLPNGTKVISRPKDTTTGSGGTIEIQIPGRGRAWGKIRF